MSRGKISVILSAVLRAAYAHSDALSMQLCCTALRILRKSWRFCNLSWRLSVEGFSPDDAVQIKELSLVEANQMSMAQMAGNMPGLSTLKAAMEESKL